IGIEFDLLFEYLELGSVDDFAVDQHPAAFDVLLRFPARTPGQFDDAFGEADGFGHRRDLGGWKPIVSRRRPASVRGREHDMGATCRLALAWRQQAFGAL